jgi:hypothetical protein
LPFEIPLTAKMNKQLYETYHGVFVNIQVGSNSARYSCNSVNSRTYNHMKNIKRFSSN